jgi:hypothetical protein
MATTKKKPAAGTGVRTPEGDIHIIAALLAAGGPPPNVPPDRPMFAITILMTKYRQYVRMLSPDQDSESA